MRGKKSDAFAAAHGMSPVKMSSSRSTPVVMSSQMLRTFGAQFKAFAPKVWNSYDGESSSDWARAQAREFWHTVNSKVPFAVVYNGLLRFANMMLGESEAPRAKVMVVDLPTRDESDEDYEDEDYEDEDYEDEEYITPSLQRDARLVNAIVPDDQQTLAEGRYARYELNRTLIREFNAWYDAFEAEAAEDTEKNAPMAEQRFTRHCAKILGRRTGLRQDLLEAVVDGWLEAHLERGA